MVGWQVTLVRIYFPFSAAGSIAHLRRHGHWRRGTREQQNSATFDARNMYPGEETAKVNTGDEERRNVVLKFDNFPYHLSVLKYKFAFKCWATTAATRMKMVDSV